MMSSFPGLRVAEQTERVQISDVFRYREQMKIVNPDQSPTLDSLRRRLDEEGFDTLLLGRPPGEWAPEVTGLLVVSDGDLTRTFAVVERDADELEVLGEPNPRWLGSVFGLFAGPDFTAMFGSQADGQLLVAPSIGPRAARALWQQGIGYADAFGNVSLPMGAKRVEFRGGAQTGTPELDKRTTRPAGKSLAAAFSLGGLPVSLALMVQPTLLEGTLRDIQSAVPASLGKVQEVVRALEDANWILRGPHGRILQGRRMLDAWTEAYVARWDRWHPPKTYDADVPDPMEILWRFPGDTPHWLGGETAAGGLGLPIQPMTILIYAEEGLRSSLIKGLRLRSSQDGTISFGQPLWGESLVPEQLAPPIVIRADLLASGAPRQAEIAERMVEDVADLRRLVGR